MVLAPLRRGFPFWPGGTESRRPELPCCGRRESFRERHDPESPGSPREAGLSRLQGVVRGTHAAGRPVSWRVGPARFGSYGKPISASVSAAPQHATLGRLSRPCIFWTTGEV